MVIRDQFHIGTWKINARDGFQERKRKILIHKPFRLLLPADLFITTWRAALEQGSLTLSELSMDG